MRNAANTAHMLREARGLRPEPDETAADMTSAKMICVLRRCDFREHGMMLSQSQHMMFSQSQRRSQHSPAARHQVVCRRTQRVIPSKRSRGRLSLQQTPLARKNLSRVVSGTQDTDTWPNLSRPQYAGHVELISKSSTM